MRVIPPGPHLQRRFCARNDCDGVLNGGLVGNGVATDDFSNYRISAFGLMINAVSTDGVLDCRLLDMY